MVMPSDPPQTWEMPTPLSCGKRFSIRATSAVEMSAGKPMP
jgi:hypothetical protein